MLRTQVYLTDAQRRELDRIASSEGSTLAEIIRQAIDSFLRRGGRKPDIDQILAETFGSLPDIEVAPRAEWNREL